MTTKTNGAIVALLLLGLGMLTSACANEPEYPSLPDGVSAAIGYDGELYHRWHIGAFVQGDVPESSLRLLCITESTDDPHPDWLEHPSAPEPPVSFWVSQEDASRTEHVVWSLDGEEWNHGRFRRDNRTSPPRFVADSEEAEQALIKALRSTEVAQVTLKRFASADKDDLTIIFDVKALRSTPVQFAIDDCRNEVAAERVPEPIHINAQWLPDISQHFYAYTRSATGAEASFYVTCSPVSLLDEGALDDAAVQPDGDLFFNVGVFFVDRSMVAEGDADVTWGSNVIGRHRSQWRIQGGWLSPPPFDADHLRFYDALRRSETLQLSVITQDGSRHELTLPSSDLIGIPLTAELDGCVREYADQYEQ